MSEPVPKTQQMIFSAQVIPELFHATPDSFQFLVNRDGTKFLRFYWDEVAKKLPPEQHQDSFGLNFFMRTPNARTSVILISLPEPTTPGEAYYIALVHRPYRRLLLVSDTTTVLVLESAPAKGEAPPTQLVEWSRKMQRFELKSGIPPVMEDFYRAVLDEIAE